VENQSKTTRILQTALYFYISIIVGLFLAARGAMLPNLADQVGVGLGQIGIIITASSIGFLIANLLLGRFYDRVPGHRLMMAGSLLTTVIIFVLPFTDQLSWLFFIFLLSGLARGVLILGNNTLPLWIYGNRSASVVTALAGTFGAGSVIGPWLVGQVFTRTGSTLWVFWISAIGFLLFVPAALLVPSPPIRREPMSNPKSAAAHTINENKQIIVLMAVFLVFYVGAEVGLGSWITTFGQTQLPVSEAHRAYQLASFFWIAMTAGRFFSSLLSSRIGTEKLLVMNLLGMIGSLLIVIFSGGQWGWLFGGTITLGLSMASIFPLVFALAEEVMDVTGRISSTLFIGASTGSIIFPLVMGKMIESINPINVMVMLLGMTIVDVVIFGFLYLSIRRNKTKHQG
jgi:fucose permease